MAVTLETIRLLTVRGRTEGMDRVQAELAGVSRAHFDVARASDEMARATDTSARRQASVAAGWSKVTSEMQGSSRAAREYASVVRLAAQAEQQNLTTAQQSAQVRMWAQSRLQNQVIRGPAVDQSGLNALLGMQEGVTTAARASADAFSAELDRMDVIADQKARQIGQTFQEQLNRSLGIGASSAQSQGATFGALEAQMRQMEEIEKARAAQNASTTQQGYTERFGMGGGSKSAKESASAFEAAAREAEEMERKVAALRMQLDPLAALQSRFNAELVEYRALASAGAISSTELAAAEGMVGTRMALAGKHIGAAGDATKLTSFQMTGLGYQINDIATMVSMGASPFMVISSQAGQVIQVLGDGPGGMKGSLAALYTGVASLVTPATAVTAGLVALGGAAIYFGVKGRDSVKPLNEAMEEHRKIIDDIAASYGTAIDARDDYQSGATRAFNLRQSEADLRLSARSSLLDNGFAGGGDMLRARRTDDGGRTYEAYEEFKAFEGPLVKLAQGLRSGTDDARKFVDEVARIANLDPSNEELQKTAANLTKLAGPAADAKARLDALTSSIMRMKQVSISEAGERFAQFLPDNRTDRDDIQRAYAARIASIGQLSGSNRGLAESMQIAAANDLRAALGELDRQEDVIRKGRELDIKAITAKTTAERAGIAAERERQSLSGVAMDPAKRQASIDAASQLVYAEDAEREREYLRQTVRGREDAISSLRIEAETFGMTRGAAQAYRMEQEQILALYRRAEDTGGIVDQAEIDRIRQAAQATGALTDSIIAMGDAREQQAQLRGLVSEAGLLGASDDQVRLGRVVLQEEERLRRQNIDLTSEQARATIDGAKAMSDYGDQIRRSGDAWNDWRRTGEGAIDSLVDSLTSGDLSGALKGIGSDLLKAGLELGVTNPLKNGLLGTSYGTLADMFAKPGAPLLSGLGELGTMANPMYVRMDPLGLGGLAGLGGAGGNPLGAAGAIAQNFGLGKQGALGANGLMPVSDVAAYIQKAAIARGIDPGTALRVARSEGLGEGIWQSNFSRNGFREPSFGPFQLLKGGSGTGYGRGMGNDFMRQTGLDPADPRNTYAGVDFALDGAAKNGWGAWFEAGRAGIGNREGLSGARAIGVGGAGGTDAVSALTASQEALTQASTTIATTATAFGMNFDLNASTMLNGMKGTIGDFLPAFGGSLTSLISSLSSSTGISTGTVGKILGGAVGLFDVGGHTGYGDSRDVAGFVHRNEIVWSQKDIARSGGLAAVEAMRLGGRGYMKGGVVGGYDSPAPLTMPSFDYAANEARASNQTPFVYAPVINAPGADRAGLDAVREEIRAQGEQMRQMNKGIESRVDRRQKVSGVRKTRA